MTRFTDIVRQSVVKAKKDARPCGSPLFPIPDDVERAGDAAAGHHQNRSGAQILMTGEEFKSALGFARLDAVSPDRAVLCFASRRHPGRLRAAPDAPGTGPG
jgi:hypothetical protein